MNIPSNNIPLELYLENAIPEQTILNSLDQNEVIAIIIGMKNSSSGWENIPTM